MINRIKGKLDSITDQYALIDNNGIYYQILVPSALADRLKENGKVGEPISFETIYYIEAGDRKSNHYPRLVGFTSSIDREFFSLFTQVPGLGVKKALKCLVIPIKDIASAIETRNPSTLSKLPGVGARLAEKIIAELHGKTAKFALSKDGEPLAKSKPAKTVSAPFQEEAIEVLTQLQYKRQEAEAMIEKALESNAKIGSVEELISYIFKNQLAK
ncbi:MAG: Holliday junction ATP-dependent DNA helicase RuvA [bacterium]|nr:Holliday junction ATP-dependent DNA helicase RuvA [bacterium]